MAEGDEFVESLREFLGLGPLPVEQPQRDGPAASVMRLIRCTPGMRGKEIAESIARDRGYVCRLLYRLQAAGRLVQSNKRWYVARHGRSVSPS